MPTPASAGSAVVGVVVALRPAAPGAVPTAVAGAKFPVAVVTVAVVIPFVGGVVSGVFAVLMRRVDGLEDVARQQCQRFRTLEHALQDMVHMFYSAWKGFVCAVLFRHHNVDCRVARVDFGAYGAPAWRHSVVIVFWAGFWGRAQSLCIPQRAWAMCCLTIW